MTWPFSAAARLGPVERHPAGSAFKICAVAEGRADAYPRFGPTSEWDTAAAQVVLEEAGGHLLDARGRRFRYNRRDTLLNAHKTELRNSLDIANSLIKPLYDAAPKGESAEKDQAIALLKQLKYGKDGYYFGYDGSSVRVFSGSDSARIGDSFRDYKDVNGVFLINELVKQGQAGGGFVTYHFPRLGQGDTAYPKLSYAIWLDKWDLMLGTGFYIDSIDSAVASARAVAFLPVRRL